MGCGPRRWHVTLDWILDEANCLKVLEGNFDDASTCNQEKTDTLKKTRSQERDDILESIADPLWKEWCSQLNTSLDSREAVSLLDLKAIAPAQFLEVDEDGLLWIGSSDKRALNHIENLRLPLLSLMERKFPKIRNLRTRFEEKSVALSSSPLSLNSINQGASHA